MMKTLINLSVYGTLGILVFLGKVYGDTIPLAEPDSIVDCSGIGGCYAEEIPVNVRGDFDGDGRKDIVYADVYGTKLLYGGGFPAFSTQASNPNTQILLPNGIGAQGIQVLDLDGDGYDDLILDKGYFNPPKIFVVWGRPRPNGNLDFRSTQDLVIEGKPGAGQGFAWTWSVCDLNHDGRKDLVIGAAGTSPGEVYVLRGRPRQEFASSTIQVDDPSFGLTLVGEGGCFGSDIAAGDVDGDGYDDLILSDRCMAVGSRTAAGKAYVVRGSGVFPSGSQSINALAYRTILGPHANSSLGAIFAADISGDGKADLGIESDWKPVLLSGADIAVSGSTVDLSTAQPGHVEGMAITDPLGRNGMWILPGDYDGDGRPDLFVDWSDFQHSTHTVSLYSSQSFPVGVPWPKSFTATSLNIVRYGFTLLPSVRIGVGDVNGDGESDLVLSPRDDQKIRVFFGFAALERPSIVLADRSPDQARIHLILGVDGQPTEMKLSGDFIDAVRDQWIPFQKDAYLTLSPAEGSKTISVIFRNLVSRVSLPVSVTLPLAVESAGTSVVTNLLREGGAARFEARLDAPGHVKASVYSREARLVNILMDEDQSAGVHLVEWDGTNAERKHAAPGLYFIVIEAGGRMARYKVVVQ